MLTLCLFPLPLDRERGLFPVYPSHPVPRMVDSISEAFSKYILHKQNPALDGKALCVFEVFKLTSVSSKTLEKKAFFIMNQN